MRENPSIPEQGSHYPQSREREKLGLYIHIPFCVRKCDYCDFLSAPGSQALKKDYTEALLTEIESYRGRTAAYVVPTIFIGGGTPSCIPAADIERIMTSIKGSFNIEGEGLEATIEINPGTVTKEKLLDYQRAGLNRISFGLQSTENIELKRLGRIHCYEDFLLNYRLARELGFHNINVDLMSALPGQTVTSWEQTLHRIAGLEPEHISAYSLIIEEGTGFYDRYRPGAPREKELPDEDTDRLIYYRTKEILERYGYHRYEISNYAKPGRECRHNNSYWSGVQYLGLGLGAASLLGNVRFSNIRNVEKYINRLQDDRGDSGTCSVQPGTAYGMEKDLHGIRQDIKPLTIEEQMEEFLFLGLRRCDGISEEAFARRFGKSIEAVYGHVLLRLLQQQLIIKTGDQLMLTEYGIDISNAVLAEFLID